MIDFSPLEDDYNEPDITPLYSIPAEQTALGSMLLSPRAAEELADLLVSEDFYRPAHRILFETFVLLLNASIELDVITVVDALKVSKRLGDIGGEDYLLEMASDTPSPANATYYAGIVKDRSILRQMLEIHERSAALIRAGTEVDDAIRSSSGLEHLAAAGGKPPVTELRDIVIDHDVPLGLPTGLACLDKALLTGGLPIGQMTIIGAKKSGGGKSILAETIAVNAALDGKRVMYALFADISNQAFKARAIQMLCGLAEKPREGSRFMETYRQAEGDIEFMELKVYDATQDTQTLERFFAYAVRQHKLKPFDLIVMDYAQVFELDRKTNDQVQLGFYGAKLCAKKAKQMGIPIVVVSQLTEDRTSYSTQWNKECALELHIESDGVKVFKDRFGGQDPLLPIKHDDLYAKYVDLTAELPHKQTRMDL